MAEKRKSKRRHLIYYLKVYDRTTGQLIGQIGDITTEGIMLITESPIDPNRLFQFRMLLPEEIEGKKEIYFDAKSLWCNKDINPNFYNVGFKMINISMKQIDIIKNLIYDYSFND